MPRQSPSRGSAGALSRSAARLLALGLACPAAAAPPPLPTPPTVAALPPEQVGARGARLPFLEYEAENAVHDGEAIGPGRDLGTIAAEASGRRAVRLAGPGRFVEFTLAAPANALTVRYAVPDGTEATLSVEVEGRRVGALRTTSRYGWYYGAAPFTNDPAAGGARHFFDEARLLLGRTVPAGGKVRLAVGAGDAAPWYAIDLADFELVAEPAAAPAGAVSIARFGADPTGRRSAYRAIVQAIRAARGRGVPVWIPPGRFRVDRHIRVDRVTIAGAGPWHSILTGNGVGLYGRKAPRGSRAVTLRDFAIIGEVGERDDKAALAGIGGAIGGGSHLSNLWIQHHKVGLWFDGPMDGIRISGLRILDNAADGLNFRRGVTNAVVENSFVRNSGDDGLAMWSHRLANSGNAFRNNIVIAPNLANGIAIYGGRDIEVVGNVVADTLTQGGGIHVGNRFDAVPAAGRIRIADNLVLRSGSFDPNWRFGVGALWFYALDAPLAADIEVSGLDIVDSTLEAIQFIGKRIDGATLDGVRIDGASHAFQLRSEGRATASRVVAAGLREGGILSCVAGFELVPLTGNEGWSGRSDEGCQAR